MRSPFAVPLFQASEKWLQPSRVLCGDAALGLPPVSVKKTFLLGEPLPCKIAAETPIQPLLWCFCRLTCPMVFFSGGMFLFTDTGILLATPEQPPEGALSNPPPWSAVSPSKGGGARVYKHVNYIYIYIYIYIVDLLICVCMYIYIYIYMYV